MSERFYFPELSDGASIEIGGSEAHHMIHVMRIESGAKIELFDGKGHVATGVVENTSRKSLTVSVTSLESCRHKLSRQLVVAVALPKGDRARFLVEKLTELGVATLVPLVTVRSTVRPESATIKKLARYVIEASKQCGRNMLMEIGPATGVRELASQFSERETRIVLHPRCESVFSQVDLGQSGSSVVCIGPEGGWDPQELEELTNNGWIQRSLGERVLRTETAAMAIASVASLDDGRDD